MDITSFVKDYHRALIRFDEADSAYIETASYEVQIAKSKLNAAIAEAKGKTDVITAAQLPWVTAGTGGTQLPKVRRG